MRSPAAAPPAPLAAAPPPAAAPDNALAASLRHASSSASETRLRLAVAVAAASPFVFSSEPWKTSFTSLRLHSAAKHLVAHLAAPSAVSSGPAGGLRRTFLSAPHTALRCGRIASRPNDAPHAHTVASASSRVFGGLVSSRLSRTWGTAHGAYDGDAHIAERSVAASCSCVTNTRSFAGGRKETGKYAATTS